MPSYCSRCGGQVYGQAAHQPHVCRDLTKRLARQQRQLDVVATILCGYNLDDAVAKVAAISIVGALNRLGITED